MTGFFYIRNSLNSMMNHRRILCFLLFFLFFQGFGQDKPFLPDFEKHIKFNHLYVVLDEETYQTISDSIPFFKEFSYFKESLINAGDESWSGKYLSGKYNYLELFKPNSYEGAKMGDVGIGFISEKLGVLNVISDSWKSTKDSVKVENRDYILDGKSYPWYISLSLPEQDSLKLSVWLMENRKEHLNTVGFSDEDLEKPIDYWKYTQQAQSMYFGVPADSVKYEKLFDKVEVLHLLLSKDELEYLTETLTGLGFIQHGKSFLGHGDFVIFYELTNEPHSILQEIEIKLTKKQKSNHYSFHKLEVLVEGDIAKFKFNN